MKIVNCPKGGRVPEGYCKESCLNYAGDHLKAKTSVSRKLRSLFKNKRKSWLQIYKEDVFPRLKNAM